MGMAGNSRIDRVRASGHVWEWMDGPGTIRLHTTPKFLPTRPLKARGADETKLVEKKMETIWVILGLYWGNGK